MTRRIVQIAAVGHENDQMWQGRTELFALCDDSTAWYQVHGEAAWVPIPDVPQDTPAVSCPDCNGHGTIFSPTEPLPDFCYLCGGTGKVAPSTLIAAGGSPAESPDPIAEIEKCECFLVDAVNGLHWETVDGKDSEVIGMSANTADVADLRAAAARLLERVRGAK